MTGDGGIGKSWLVLTLILAVASGQPWLGEFETKQGPVLVVDEENTDILLRIRLGKLLRGYGLDAGDLAPIHFLVGKIVDLTPHKTASGQLTGSKSYWRLFQTIRDLKPPLVAFDSLTRVHHANENYAHEMAPVFNQAKQLVNNLGCTVVFTHHTNKAGNYRGSTDIRNFADWTLQVEKEHDGLAVEHEKARWAEPVERFRVDWRADPCKDELALVYAGEASKRAKGAKAELKTVWEFVKDLLGCKGKLTRQELIAAVEGAELCKQRKLDGVLKWRFENGFVGKELQGREAVYFLLEEAEPLHVQASCKGPVQ